MEGTYERWGEHMGFSERRDTIFNGTEYLVYEIIV